eukprot:gene17815-19593_t
MDNEIEELVLCLETQLTEIETISCIFSEEEYTPCSEESISQIRDLCLEYREKTSYKNPVDFLREIFDLKYLCFDLKLPLLYDLNREDSGVSSLVLNINYVLPHLYPKELPRVYISSDKLNRTEQSVWNDALKSFINQNKSEDPMVYNIVDWIRENADKFINIPEQMNASNEIKVSCEQKSKTQDEQHAAMWLYMHHIYNKEKRKDIINWAKELELSGFSLPGKPGVVYVEGTDKNIDDYFARLKRLSWKRMSCVQKDFIEIPDRKFSDFQELNFDAHGARDYHMDLGKFHVFLKENGLGDMFTVLFGIKKD